MEMICVYEALRLACVPERDRVNVLRCCVHIQTHTEWAEVAAAAQQRKVKFGKYVEKAIQNDYNKTSIIHSGILREFLVALHTLYIYIWNNNTHQHSIHTPCAKQAIASTWHVDTIVNTRIENMDLHLNMWSMNKYRLI